MSAPFKTPAKKEVKIVGKDDKLEFANKIFTQDIKAAVEAFVKTNIDVLTCQEMLEDALWKYCRMANRIADLEMLERQADLMEEEEEFNSEEEGNPDFIDSVHSQPRWED